MVPTKQIVLFGIVLLVCAAQQGDAAAPLNSTLKKALVLILEKINIFHLNYEEWVSQYWEEKLQNETEIQEWSVKIQSGLAINLTKLAFAGFEAYKKYIEAHSPSAQESKVLECLSNGESAVLETVQNATSQNGWCNNRLAANLSRAFQELNTALLNFTTKSGEKVETLNKCVLLEDICVANYAAGIAKLFVEAASGKDGTVSKGVQDVYAVYKIMFGEDVPRCAKEYLFPILLDGLRTTGLSVLTCIDS